MLSDKEIEELWVGIHKGKFMHTGFNTFARAIEAAVLEELAKQEPVAWLIPGTITRDAALARANGRNATPLYAAPVVQPDMVMVPMVGKCQSCGHEHEIPKQVQEEGKCSTHPDAPHGFDRNASHNAGRYVCECEGWGPVVQPDRVVFDTATGEVKSFVPVQHDAMMEHGAERLAEVERKLAIAVDALKVSAIMPRSHEAHRRAAQALAQIGGEYDKQRESN